jgi:hypothetical protein
LNGINNDLSFTLKSFSILWTKVEYPLTRAKTILSLKNERNRVKRDVGFQTDMEETLTTALCKPLQMSVIQFTESNRQFGENWI